MSDVIFERLKEIASDRLDLSRITFQLSSRWIEDLGADSMDLAELAIDIEENWDINMENHAFLVVEDTVEIISTKLALK